MYPDKFIRDMLLHRLCDYLFVIVTLPLRMPSACTVYGGKLLPIMLWSL